MAPQRKNLKTLSRLCDTIDSLSVLEWAYLRDYLDHKIDGRLDVRMLESGESYRESGEDHAAQP